ncbi:FxsB family cyclophane-forming radical SAM/SPASM peptide maturase [Nocardia sp. NPDC049190]|uniref:FxsB family cyclophane-forming radical SAM/SPASM peptide maturase n=1 Tax=Nocardia sp. NPDC049190 TaxID=3155650 RepID=UPI00340F71A3
MISPDVEQLRARGWRPLPFIEFVIKIHSRCNLACDYCYVYEMADQSWRQQPVRMRDDLFLETCRLIRSHAEEHALPAVSLVFHGGEPLLVGHDRMAYFARNARELLEPVTALRLRVQTNGVLLDNKFLEICERHRIMVGVSVDGNQQAHDRHRINRRGIGSYDHVAKALARLASPEYRSLYSILLCTIDVANDPIATYEALLGFEPPVIDFHLPYGNWTTPPPAKSDALATTAYGDWLIEIFDRWYGAPVLETRIRIFDHVMGLLLGRQQPSEFVGLAPMQFAVIETDGSVEQVDSLKSAYAGAASLGITAEGNPLDQAMWAPGIIARQIGIAALGDTCRSCSLVGICGGGHYVHRYREGSGFRNPSVYCADLQKLIGHIESRLRADLTAAMRS